MLVKNKKIKENNNRSNQKPEQVKSSLSNDCKERIYQIVYANLVTEYIAQTDMRLNTLR